MPPLLLYRGGKSDSLFLYSALSLRLLDALVLYGMAYLQTGMLMILALQRCFPPSTSLGLLPYTEGNKDTRRISVVCLTKWLPESVRAIPMGSTAASLSSVEVPPAWVSLRSALTQGALWMCDRLWVGEFVLMLKRQRTQTDNPGLKQCCSNFPPWTREHMCKQLNLIQSHTRAVHIFHLRLSHSELRQKVATLWLVKARKLPSVNPKSMWPTQQTKYSPLHV